MKISIYGILCVLVSVHAYAMKCEVVRGKDGADCDYRAYVHGSKVDLYAFNCAYNDDNGGPVVYPASSLKRKKNGKYSLGASEANILLTCEH